MLAECEVRVCIEIPLSADKTVCGLGRLNADMASATFLRPIVDPARLTPLISLPINGDNSTSSINRRSLCAPGEQCVSTVVLGDRGGFSDCIKTSCQSGSALTGSLLTSSSKGSTGQSLILPDPPAEVVMDNRISTVSSRSNVESGSRGSQRKSS
jgi:hypothetical protein